MLRVTNRETARRGLRQRHILSQAIQRVSEFWEALLRLWRKQMEYMPTHVESLECRRLMATINVSSYVTVDDGNSDLSGIATAIAASSPGDTLFFSAGVYDLPALDGSGSVELAPGRTYLGEAGTTLRRPGSLLDSNDAIFYANGADAEDILIQGLTFEGAGVRFGADGMLWADNVDIDRCTFQNAPVGNGSMINISAGAENSDITNNVFRNLQCYAGVWAMDIDQLKILNNKFDTVYQGVHIINFEDGAEGVEVSGNRITGAIRMGIEIQGGSSEDVEFDGLEVNDNIISDFRTDTSGDYIGFGMSIVSESSTNMIVEGNKLYGVLLGAADPEAQPVIGIEIIGAAGTEVNDNLVEGYYVPIMAGAYPDPAGSMSLDGNRLRGEYDSGLGDGIARVTGATYNVTNHNASMTVESAVIVGDDLIVAGTSGADTISLTGTSTVTVTIGGVGKGTYSPAGGVFVNSDGGNDAITVAGGLLFSSTLCGSTGNDTLTGNNLAGELYGDDGTDSLVGGSGGDALHGGEGVDTVSYSARVASVTIRLDGLANDGGSGESDNVTSMEVLQGGTVGDTIVGDSNANTILGGAGSDSVHGRGGTDTLSYSTHGSAVSVNLGTNSSSDDSSISGFENAIGGTGNDTLTGSTAANVLDGGSGNDSMKGGDSNDTLFGGDGSDSLYGNLGADSLLGGNNNDTIGGGDYLLVGDGVTASDINDIIDGGAGNDLLYGDGANDTFKSGATVDGSDTIHGGGGSANVIDYSLRTSAVRIDATGSLTSGQTGSEADVLDGTCHRLYGGSGADLIIGTVGNETINGNGGNDTISAASGNDVIDAGNGNDSCLGLDGNDTIYGGNGEDNILGGLGADLIDGGANDDDIGGGDYYTPGGGVTAADVNDTLIGSSGNDIIYGDGANDLFRSGSIPDGSDTLYGGGGSANQVDYSDRTGAVRIDATGSLTSGETSFGEADVLDGTFHRLSGGKGNDTIIATSGTDTLTGNDGNDSLVSSAGSDTLNGNGGNDTLTAGSAADGNDVLNGGDGIDLADYFSRTNAVTISLNGTNGDGETGASESDNVGTDVENVNTGGGADTITGSSSNNTLYGGNSNDSITGGDGNDSLLGVSGSDTLSGGNGSDTLRGSTSGDSMIGGSGTDYADYTDKTAQVIAALNAGSTTTGNGTTGENDSIASDVEGILGGSGNDSLTGSTAANDLRGNGGNDTLKGGNGNDTIYAGTGTDSVLGENDDDIISAEDATVDVINGGTGNNIFFNLGAEKDVDLTSEGDAVNDTVSNMAIGSLVGTSADPDFTYDLTAAGTLDWAHWGTGSFIHKSGSGPLISNVTSIGSPNVDEASDANVLLNWTNPSSGSSQTDNESYLINTGPANSGWKFTAPADTTERILYVVVGGRGAHGLIDQFATSYSLTAHLTDGSAEDFVATAASIDQFRVLYTIKYKAASASKQLEVSLVKTSNDFNVLTPQDNDDDAEINDHVALVAAWLTTAAAPAAPSVIHATTLGSDKVQLVWRDNSSNESSWKIDYSTSNTFPVGASTSTVTINKDQPIPAGVHDLRTTISGLNADTTYYFRIRAANETGESSNSSVVDTTTQLGSPTSVAATVDGDTVTLDWTNSPGSTSVSILRSTDGRNYSVIDPSETDTSFEDEPGPGVFYYRVQATDGVVQSDPSAVVIAPVEGGDVEIIDVVADFGALPNDGIDDTSFIENALNAAEEGDIVLFPDGTYNLTSVGGDGLTVSTLENPTDPSLRDRTLVGLGNATLKGAGANGMLVTYHGDDILVTGLTFLGGGLFFEQNGNPSHNIVIDHNKFYTESSTGDYNNGITFSNGIDGAIISNNYFTSTTDEVSGEPLYENDWAIYCQSYHNNLKIYNNEIVDFGAGMHVDTGGGGVNLEVQQNYVTGTIGTGFEFQGGVAGAKFYDNTYENPNFPAWEFQGDGVYAFSLPLDTSTNVDIRQNTVIAPQRTDGIGVRIAFEVGGGSAPSDQTLVTHNYVNGVNHVVAANDGNGPMYVVAQYNLFLNVRQGPSEGNPGEGRTLVHSDNEVSLDGWWDIYRRRPGIDYVILPPAV